MNPDWKQEHEEQLDQYLKKPGAEGGEPPAGRQRLNADGKHTETKKEAKHDRQSGDEQDKAAENEERMEQEDGVSINIRNLEISVKRLEHFTTTVVKVIERFDQNAGDSILIIKKKDVSMGNFYGEANKIVTKLVDDRYFSYKIAKITSAGPFINTESKTYVDIRAVRDKTKSLVDASGLQDKVLVVQGAAP